MSKINQIENGIKELEGGAFQKLANAYLLAKGYPQINAIGSVIGSNKTKSGTPDALIPLPNGKYVFAEYTTQEKGVFEKFGYDLKKCFDEDKTGIPINKIDGVVLCHTTELEPKELEQLRLECQKYAVNLNVFGITSISYDLCYYFPGIAKDHLNVEVDTGQILTISEFVTRYGCNKLSTRLDTTFRFREKELDETTLILEKSNLVIVSGHAGVGKSRFALECCEKFSQKHPSYKVLCILNEGLELYDDIRDYFSLPGEFLILVDDANRLNDFGHIIRLLQDQRNDQCFKVIVTVRDYALDKVKERCAQYGTPQLIHLAPLSDGQIEQLVEEEYGIINYSYLERISAISKGNPRLAIMAAEIAKEKNTIESIHDVSELYDKYYSSIRMDLQDLIDQNILKVAGIVAFFRSVDRSHQEFMTQIVDVFSITQDEFWNTARKLNEMEVFDMHEDEVIKVADQVLATYLFYLAFFKDKILDFGLILKHFFPRYHQRLVDAINPVLSVFNAAKIVEQIRPHVENAYKSRKDDAFEFMEAFCSLMETEALKYCKDQIDSMASNIIEMADLKFEPNTSGYPHPIIKILSQFKASTDANFSIAIDLLFRYLIKRQESLPEVLNCIIDTFGFDHTPRFSGFHIQKTVINMIWEKTKQGENRLFSKLFIAVAEKYLHTHFSKVGSVEANSVKFKSLTLLPIPPLIELRTEIWQHLFLLWEVDSLQDDVLELLNNHSTPSEEVAVKEIIEHDKKVVMPFLCRELDNLRFWHCFVGQKYLGLLSRVGVTFEPCIGDCFLNQTYILYKILSPDEREFWRLNKDDENFNWHDEFERIKRQKIREHTENYNFDDYNLFFEHCLEIKRHLQDRDGDVFLESIPLVLILLAERDEDLYEKVLSEYLQKQDFLNLNPIGLVESLMVHYGYLKAYKTLNGASYHSKKIWMFWFYYHLPQQDIEPDHIKQLFDLYHEAEVGDYPNNLDFLLKFQSLEKTIIVRVAEIIFAKAENNPAHISALSQLFNSFTEVNKQIIVIFSDNMDLLERVYLAVCMRNSYADNEHRTFSRILDVDPTFVDRYFDDLFNKERFPHRHNSPRHYSFIWKREDCDALMNRIIQKIFEREAGNFPRSYLEVFFGTDQDEPKDALILERQDCFIRRLIEERSGDIEFMKFLFGTISALSSERRVRLIAHFIKFNIKFEDFERLSIEPNKCRSVWGSFIPELEGKLNYLDSLNALFDTADFLEHKFYIGNLIKAIRGEIQEERKRDFTEDRG